MSFLKDGIRAIMAKRCNKQSNIVNVQMEKEYVKRKENID
jgi:hypothetical protein